MGSGRAIQSLLALPPLPLHPFPLTAPVPASPPPSARTHHTSMSAACLRRRLHSRPEWPTLKARHVKVGTWSALTLQRCKTYAIHYRKHKKHFRLLGRRCCHTPRALLYTPGEGVLPKLAAIISSLILPAASVWMPAWPATRLGQSNQLALEVRVVLDQNDARHPRQGSPM